MHATVTFANGSREQVESKEKLKDEDGHLKTPAVERRRRRGTEGSQSSYGKASFSVRSRGTALKNGKVI